MEIPSQPKPLIPISRDGDKPDKPDKPDKLEPASQQPPQQARHDETADKQQHEEEKKQDTMNHQVEVSVCVSM